MNCTVVYLVAAQPIGATEMADLRLHLVLEGLKPGELVHSPGQSLQVLDDQRTYRGVALRSRDPRVAVDIIWNGDRNVLHSFTVTQNLWKADGSLRPF
jgi:hypothetical protein